MNSLPSTQNPFTEKYGGVVYESMLFVLFLTFLVSICVVRWNYDSGLRATMLLAFTWFGSCIFMVIQTRPFATTADQLAILDLTAVFGNFLCIAAGSIIGAAARNVAKLLAAQADAVKLKVEKRERPAKDNGSMP